MLYIGLFGILVALQAGGCSKPVPEKIGQENVSEPTTTVDVAKIRDFSVKGSNLWLVEDNGNFTLYRGNETPEFQQTKLDAQVQNVSFIDAKVGWALDDRGQITSTSDSGLTWRPRGKIGDESATTPFSGRLVFSTPTIGWFGDMAEVWRTGDGGDNWMRVYPTNEFSYSTLKAQPLNIFVVNPETVWVGMTNGKVLVTNDQGGSWKTAQQLPEEIDVESLFCSNEKTCWAGASGGGGLYLTQDGGGSWRQVLRDEIKNSLSISSVFFANAQTGWIAGTSFYSTMDDTRKPSCLLLKTRDGGQTWNQLDSKDIGRACTAVSFTDEQNGWLVGDDFVFHSSDGGENWTTVVQVR